MPNQTKHLVSIGHMAVALQRPVSQGAIHAGRGRSDRAGHDARSGRVLPRRRAGQTTLSDRGLEPRRSSFARDSDRGDPMSDLLQLVAPVSIQAAAPAGKRPTAHIVAYGGDVVTVPGFGPIVIDLAGMALSPSLPILIDHRNELGGIVGTGTTSNRRRPATTGRRHPCRYAGGRPSSRPWQSLVSPGRHRSGRNRWKRSSSARATPSRRTAGAFSRPLAGSHSPRNHGCAR